MIALKNKTNDFELLDMEIRDETRDFARFGKSEQPFERPDFSKIGKMELTKGQKLLLRGVQAYAAAVIMLLGWHILTLLR